MARNPTSIQIPGLLILRPNEGIFFANASGLQDAIMSLVAAQETPAQAVVLDLEMSNELDAPGAEMLHDLHADLSCQEIQLMLARVRPPVLAMLERSGTLDNIGAENVYVRTLNAMLAFLQTRGEAGTTLLKLTQDELARVQEIAAAAAAHVGEEPEAAQYAQIAQQLAAIDAHREDTQSDEIQPAERR